MKRVTILFLSGSSVSGKFREIIKGLENYIQNAFNYIL